MCERFGIIHAGADRCSQFCLSQGRYSLSSGSQAIIHFYGTCFRIESTVFSDSMSYLHVQYQAGTPKDIKSLKKNGEGLGNSNKVVGVQCIHTLVQVNLFLLSPLGFPFLFIKHCPKILSLLRGLQVIMLGFNLNKYINNNNNHISVTKHKKNNKFTKSKFVRSSNYLVMHQKCLKPVESFSKYMITNSFLCHV